MSKTGITDKIALPDFLTSDGQLGGLIRNYNWSSTPLGPINQWSQSLKTTVNLMLNSANPIWIGWGPDVTFLYNDAYIEILGTEKHGWALGRPVKEVWEEVWDICGPLCSRVFQQGLASTNNDTEFYLKRGEFLEEKYFSFSYSPVFDELGNVGGLFCASYETTDKILSARRNRTLSALAEKSLTEKTIMAACAAAAETLGKNPKDIPFAIFYLTDDKKEKAEIVQRTGLVECTESLFPKTISLKDETQQGKHPLVAGVIASGKPVIAAISAPDVLPAGPAGQPVQQVIAKPIMNSAAKTIGVIVFGINPTRKLDDDYHTFFKMAASQVSKAIQNATATENERKRLEELAEIDRAKTAFFSNISHEFRTPLTLMLGPLEDLIHNTPLNGKTREAAETAHRNAMRLLRLVNTLLDFSYMESGRMKAKFTPTDISAFTASLAGNFRSVIEKAGMELVVDIKEHIEALIDRQMWEKIIFNLLSNAFKYTLEGKIIVSLTEDSGNAILRITDTGLGIPSKEMPNVFTRFHRIPSVSGRSFEGSGIGLSMIREFVLQHDGKIWVESSEGKGSTFTVTIPLSRSNTDTLIMQESPEVYNYSTISEQYIQEAEAMISDGIENAIEVEGEDVINPSDTILIADDNADMRNYLKSVTEKHYRVLLADNGKAALDIAEKEEITLIITDLMMPVMDGLTLLKELKNRPKTSLIPVILLTARAGEESRIEGFETGADDYLVKPFSAKELETRVRSQIRIAKTRGHIKQELNNLFMQAPMAICVLKGKDFIVEMANVNMLSLWKKDAATMLNRPLVEGLPEAKAQGFDKLLEQVLETGKEYIDEESPLYNDNNGRKEQLYVKFIYKPFYEENGKVSGIIALAHDVTPQVLARKKIEDSEAKFRNLIRQAPVGIVIFKGEDLVIEMANDIYLGIVARSREEIVNKKYTDAMPDLKGSAVVDNLLRVYRTGITQTYTELPVMFYRNGKKEMSYYNSVYQPLIENDKITGVIAVVNEVTDQYLAKKLKEKKDEELKTILETLPHIAFCTDPYGNVTYYNQRYSEYTGLDIEEAKAGAWRLAVHPDMLEEVERCWSDAMLGAKEYINTFLLKRGVDQKYRWHICRTVPLHDDLGNITQWVGTLTDIHEQKVFAQKLEAMVNDRTQKLHNANLILAKKNSELEQANKEMESFSYIASHDLQEPLRKIRTFINMINEKGADNLEFYLSKIDSSAQRMSQLINSVLTYSRLSSNTGHAEYVDLNITLQQVLTDFELLIEEKNVMVNAGELPALQANPLQMNQLFSNLIGNSIKYCHRDPVITISAKEIRGYDIPGYKGNNISQKYAEIRFADNGIGFEKQYSEHIFKLFQRLHGKTEYSGTGIGLSICKKIVDQHNGFIAAESVPGEGATFIVHLPLS